MSSKIIIYFSAFILVVLTASISLGAGNKTLEGNWNLIPDKSTEIDLYGTLSLEISQEKEKVIITQQWGGNRHFRETVELKTDGNVNKIKITDRVFPTNVFMGLSMPIGDTKEVTALWKNNGNVLQITENYPLLGSQGRTNISAIHTFELSDSGEILFYKIDRSTRKSGPEQMYVLKKADFKNAYYMEIEDGWEIDGKLPMQAFLISLQGVVNKNGPQLYFLYPEDWPFTYTKAVFDFYKDDRNYTFTQIKTAEEALNIFKDQVKGYVVWDKNVRTSIIVSFTLAGLEQAVVINEDLVPFVEKAGIKKIKDFRGQFTGKSDAEIYQWAYDQYWDRCNKKLIVWMGGHSGKVMKPGVADWGIMQEAFFNDLSSKPSDKEEYALASKMLGEMGPNSMVMGWHSYAKDKERDHLTLTSNYGHRVEGLNTLPNLSFSSQVPASPGFKYKNNHRIEPGKKYIPENKVYITCVQTDGIGLGAWTKPGRGEIPYAWEVTMNYYWMAPAMLEFFYTQATPNDLFIGCLSGPGYMYPKAVPPKFLPGLIEMSRDFMDKLDLNIFEIMDYSEGATVEGNTELTKQVVDAYYEGMPNAIGFLNGYAPAYTFTVRDKRPLISYDYYLSPSRPEADAVADLLELAEINSTRPYFLLMHVREWSDIKRVKSILDELGQEFELVPLDIFLKMAGENPTFKERFLMR